MSDQGKRVSFEGVVICDKCNDDYSESDAIGGMYSDGYAYCPLCAQRVWTGMTAAKRKKVELANFFETFHDFVNRLRNGNHDMTIGDLLK